MILTKKEGEETVVGYLWLILFYKSYLEMTVIMVSGLVFFQEAILF